MDSILNREEFTYNPDTDETYLQYKDSYTRGGQRAQQDTLGQVAARTGGLASSYAVSASQQAYNNYMSQLADKIPELKQLAYSMYQDEQNNKRADLNMLMGAEQNDYSRYVNDLNQYNADRNFDYGLYRDEIGDKRYDTEWDYGLSRDQLEDEWRNKQWDYQLEQDQYAKDIYDKEYNDKIANDRANLLATYGDFSAIQELYGLTDEQVKGLKYEWDRQMNASLSKGSSGGSKTKEKEPEDDEINSVRNYDDAVSYMRDKGISDLYISDLMDSTEWGYGRYEFLKNGVDNSETGNDFKYETYADYFKQFMKDLEEYKK